VRLRPRRRRPTEREKLGLTRLEPVSRIFGFDRGKPVDRWYIERFLAAHAADVRGRVLEVAEPTYTQWYGGDVTQSDVLHAAGGNEEATVVGDLVTGEGLPREAYDCFVMTQTLQVIYDVEAAVRGTRELLAPDGVLLATVPGISQISREDRRDWGDWWRFTSDSARRLFADAYGPQNIEVEAHGNVLSAACFLYGFAAEELSNDELAHRDPDFELLMTIRAVKRDRSAGALSPNARA
jgi:SAM-dependent methyltransferase